MSIPDGVINRAAQFNESDSESAIIEIPDPNNRLDDTDQLTITGWINPATYDPINSNALGILSKRNAPGSQNAYGIFMGFDGQGCSSDKLCIDINGNSGRFSSNGSIPLNQWTHFALVYDAGQARLYLNGDLDVTRSGLSSSIRASSAPLRLGDLTDGSTRKPFQGDLDEFKFFGGALSEQRIAEIFANESAAIGWDGSTRPPVQCGLVFEARMEQESWDGTPGEVLDTSGNNLHATAVGDADTALIAPAIPGNPGTCRYATLDGNGDGIVQADAADYLEGLEAITVMAWVYNSADLDDNDRGIFYTARPRGGRDNRLGMRYDADGFFGNGDNVIKASIFTDDCALNSDCHQVETVSNIMVQDQWQHVAMTWQTGDRIRVYVDGSEVEISGTVGAGTGGAIANVDFLEIGRGAKRDRWQGRIDEFRIFDGALSEAEIQQEMNDVLPCDLGYDHVRLTHPPTALTCSPAEITVSACADPDCTSLFAGQASVDFTSPTSTWTPDPVTFDGSTQVRLQYTEPDPAIELNAAAIGPAADNPTRCFSGGAETDCTMEFLESGFVIEVPDHVADLTVEGTIAAVKADPVDPVQCVPGFDNETREVAFWSSYVNPSSGSLAVAVDNSAIPDNDAGGGILIDFDGNGVGRFDVRYPDVGDVELRARYQGSGDEAGLLMLGQGQFITRPSHFNLDVADNPAADGPGDGAFIAAGVDFSVEVSARNASGDITPNFGRETPPESVRLEHALVAPVAGDEGSLSGSFGAFGTDCDDGTSPGMACGLFNWSEVGIITLTPRLESGSYLDTIDVIGQISGNVGRFIPDHFVLSGGELINRAALSDCSADYSYIGERFDAAFILTARSALGNTTMNYEGGFAFLAGSDLNLSGVPAPDISAPAVDWIMGSGDATAQLQVPRDAPAGPFRDYAVSAAPVDADGVALPDPPEQIDTTDLFFGRIVVENAVGSELGPLDLPWRVEVWDDETWRVQPADDCSFVDLAEHVQLSSSGGGGGDGTYTVSVGAGTTAIDLNCSVLTLGQSPPSCADDGPAPGRGRFRFGAPGSPGWVDLVLELDPDWIFLRDDLDDDGNFNEDPAGRASFGLFDGSPNRILLREVIPR